MGTDVTDVEVMILVLVEVAHVLDVAVSSHLLSRNDTETCRSPLSQLNLASCESALWPSTVDGLSSVIPTDPA